MVDSSTFLDPRSSIHAGFQGVHLIHIAITAAAARSYAEVHGVNLVPWSFKYQHRDLDERIQVDGKERNTYRALVVTEYVDMETGEILPAKSVKDQPQRHSENMLQREAALLRLRPEVRPFARFVLRFRNHRRGTTPSSDRLVSWYSELTGKQPEHLRRYIQPLYKAGIMAGDYLVGKQFQRAGKHLTASGHAGEDVRAIRIRQEFIHERRARSEAAAVYCSLVDPPWIKDISPRDARGARRGLLRWRRLRGFA